MIRIKHLGGSLLMVGTCIGAGMLAIPMVTYQYGIVLSIIILIACWLLMLLGAFITIDLCYKYPDGTNFQAMAADTLGPMGKGVMWVCYVLLMYSVMAAFLSGGASIIFNILKQQNLQIPNWICVFIFLIVLSSFVYSGTKSVDILNRSLLAGKFLFFAIGVGYMLSRDNLMFPGIINLNALYIAVPVLIASFTYHMVIPTVKSYLKVTKRELYLTAIIGSTIPLIIYIFWELSMLGNFPVAGSNSFSSVAASGNSVGVMLVQLSHLLNNKTFTVVLYIFYNIAITTSFLGVSISLLHFNENTYHLEQRPKFNYIITFGIPLVIIFTYPNLFVKLLQYAGELIIILFLILPGLMHYKKTESDNIKTKGQSPKQYVMNALSIALPIIGLILLMSQLWPYVDKHL